MGPAAGLGMGPAAGLAMPTRALAVAALQQVCPGCVMAEPVLEA